MNINKKKIISTVLSLCIVGGYAPVYNNFVSDYSITASAEESVTDGYLTFMVYDDYAEISSCDLAEEGEIVIPSEINGVPVTSIGNGAFSLCSEFTSIIIPKSIEKIGNNAFSNCTSLKSIDIPDSVTSMGDYAFYNCLNLESITIPNSITEINNNTFTNCTNLKSIEIPESVTSIGDSAFVCCSSLETIKIPQNVTNIGNYAFDSCSSLKSISIPESVTEIGYCAFQYCSELISVTIPESVTSIKSSTFLECSSLESITIYNPNCNIEDSSWTISNSVMTKGIFNGTIYGYEGSTAQAYAEKYGYNFAVIGEDSPTIETLAGDSNEDGQVTLADAVAILQYIANSEKYPLSEQGLANADVYNKGDGLTAMDALSIQRYDSGVITILPES